MAADFAARIAGARQPGAGALIGRTVLWYNDIENGFNRSRFTAYGTIDDYWCNPDELEVAVQYVRNALQHGSDLMRLNWNPAKVGR